MCEWVCINKVFTYLNMVTIMKCNHCWTSNGFYTYFDTDVLDLNVNGALHCCGTRCDVIVNIYTRMPCWRQQLAGKGWDWANFSLRTRLPYQTHYLFYDVFVNFYIALLHIQASYPYRHCYYTNITVQNVKQHDHFRYYFIIVYV